MEGPAVRGLQRAFQENWSEVTGEALVGDEFFPALPQAGASSVAVVPSSPLAAMSGAGRVYAISLAAAAKEIWIANSYFLPDDATVGLLVAAVKRGVDVRVIVPSDEQNDVPATKAAGRSSFGPLLEGGVKIFEYQPTMFHLKTMVVDGVFSTVGSANFDERSFHLNEEINLFVYDAAFAGQMKESYRRDLSRCRPYTHAMWKERSAKEEGDGVARRPLPVGALATEPQSTGPGPAGSEPGYHFCGTAPPAGQVVSPIRVRVISKNRTGSWPGATRSPTSLSVPSLMTAVYRIVMGPAGISQV